MLEDAKAPSADRHKIEQLPNVGFSAEYRGRVRANLHYDQVDKIDG